MIGVRDRDLTGIERLAQRIERLGLELGELIEEQHAMMRERNLSGLRAGRRRLKPACWRNDVGAERPTVGECAALQLAGDRRDHRDFEQFRRGERR